MYTTYNTIVLNINPLSHILIEKRGFLQCFIKISENSNC
jgi:hypothetical protein